MVMRNNLNQRRLKLKNGRRESGGGGGGGKVSVIVSSIYFLCYIEIDPLKISTTSLTSINGAYVVEETPAVKGREN